MPKLISSKPIVHTIELNSNEIFSIRQAFSNSRHVWANDDELKKKYEELERFFYDLSVKTVH
jgi:hypothetical protein